MNAPGRAGRHVRALRASAKLAVLLGCAQPACTEAPPASHPGSGNASSLVCAPGSYRYGDECLAAPPTCPEGTRPRGGGCVADAAKVAADPPPPPVIGEEFQSLVDPRRGRMQPRSRQLVITEQQGLEALLNATPKAGSDRPMLVRRLAEGYVELAASAARDAERSKDDDLAKARKVEEAARRSAIRYYRELIDKYPRHCLVANALDPSKSTGCTDEVLYYLSLEQVRAGQLDEAKKTIGELAQAHPKSSFRPGGNFLLGEMALSEGRTAKGVLPEQNPQLQVAEMAYGETAKESASPLVPAAYVRLAEVYELMGALDRVAAVRRRLTAEYPDHPLTKRLPLVTAAP